MLNHSDDNFLYMDYHNLYYFVKNVLLIVNLINSLLNIRFNEASYNHNKSSIKNRNMT